MDPLKFFAGTNDDVHVYIEGNVGFARTKLENLLHDDFERGCIDKFDFTAEGYLGEIQKVELSKNGSDDWRWEYVKVIDQTDKNAYILKFGDNKIKEATSGEKGAVIDIKDPTKKKKSKSSTSSEGELEEFVNEIVDEVNVMIAEANDDDVQENAEDDIEDDDEEAEEEDEEEDEEDDE